MAKLEKAKQAERPIDSRKKLRVWRSPVPSREKKGSPPAWFIRVRKIGLFGDGEVEDEDFDQDLSDLSEDEREDGNTGGKEDDSDAEDTDEDEDGDEPEVDSDESVATYDGDDAEYYYELKEQREQRKRQKHREKGRALKFESAKEGEFRDAYQSLRQLRKEGKPTMQISLGGQQFNLYSSVHVDHFYHDMDPRKYVEFYHRDSVLPSTEKVKDHAKMLCGHVYLDANAGCDFGPFRPPRHARRKILRMKSNDDKYQLSFQFIGNGYLKIMVSRDMVFMGRRAVPREAPEMFEFVGIWRDLEKERAERQARQEATRRAVSPRESWFEMNHPMGWWHQRA